ncbi:bacteriorhodopsin [Parvularcula maris]|uniref:Bacteriorhodopsin-like n=1 Tax=Parvularcula maris TaxID=2965077 RepID=A0A9X2L7U0_9PROT|nr:bacteriorhodopsin [Parvularcula maris]MCQ8184632.1 bacteriorhodopsin-like [Parvularcula maris]
MDALHHNIENFAAFPHPAYQLIAVLLMVGYGAHLAFSVYFLAASTQIAPRYRLVPWFSAVVMLAAGLSLFREFSVWSETMVFTGEDWRRDSQEVFSNAYRYANWTITIPLLLAQLLIALKLPRASMHKLLPKLVLAAIAMIWTGLVGQFYEQASIATMLVWGAISTVPFVYLVIAVQKELKAAKGRTPVILHPWLDKMFPYFLFFWGLYALAYMVPAFSDGAAAAVVRQFMYTVADVFSKLVYGLILSRFVLRLSAAEGYAPAAEALGPDWSATEPVPAHATTAPAATAAETA